MARPRKCRRVCRFPGTLEFQPVREQASDVLENSAGDSPASEPILLTVDEYEAIRLIDGEGFSQEQCSEQLQVARTTAQKIYESARRKLARMLVEGRPLRIEGGAYRLCDGRDISCQWEHCHKQSLSLLYKEKGEQIMRVAVTYENGQIFQHFGHTEAFKVYDVEDGKIVSAQVVSTNGSGHGALAEVLHVLKADVLICGGIGGGAQKALASVGIKLYGGVSGDADAAAEAFVAGQLDYDPNVKCNHHGEHHHHEGGSCGSHGCGGGSCGH